MTKKQIKTLLKRILKEERFYPDKQWSDEDEPVYLNYLGSFLSLDPCGRFHHFLSPNGITEKCERYWENMNSAAEELDCWIASGEGDGCDVFLCTTNKPKYTYSYYDQIIEEGRRG